ncbi:hypothetical protein [Metabacillus halosaccharovorans]|uniref:hypothetical protein n=1 Tax=Metabacillus halosaccharovorans TaxID=930124 RepID=UPI00203C3BDD|nr:hypothetical protein [Metabacillus halosaccharovorans]MCM3444402.1 hypothetical protein [Metabacillus halosaccharovorans]
MFKLVKDSYSATPLLPHQIVLLENQYNEAPERYKNRKGDVSSIRHEINLVIIVLGYKFVEVD